MFFAQCGKKDTQTQTDHSMSEIKPGLISQVDWLCIRRAIDSVLYRKKQGVINTCEVGLYSGSTSKAICDYIKSKGREVNHIGIDNGADGQEMYDFPSDAKFIKGNSTEVYTDIEDDSLDICFIDGNHAFPSVVADHYCFSMKVAYSGYLIYHDTAPQCQGKQWQRIGDKEHPDMGIAVRKALTEMKMFEYYCYPGSYEQRPMSGFALIYDEFDENDEAGGVCVFKKTY